MDVSDPDSELSERKSLRWMTKSVLGGALIVTTAGVVGITTAGAQSMSRLVPIIIGFFIAEFSIATLAYLALQRSRSISSVEGGGYLRTMAVAALVMSISGILFVSWFTWILGTNFRGPL